MTSLLPPPVAPPASTPPSPSPSPRTGARRLALTTVGALLLAALLNPDDVLERAQHQEFGRQRDLAVRIAELNRSVSEALWLDRPRQAIDRVLGDDDGAASASTTEAATVRPRRPTAADPLRVYLGGDSVAQALGAGLTRAGKANGVLTSTVEFRLATGLTRPDYFDWPRRFGEVLRRTPKPEVVIVMFGANDVQPIMTAAGPVRSGTEAWLAEYGRRVAATMSLLTRGGVDVYWVGQPPMRSAELSRRVSQMDDVYAAEAARHPGVTFVDTRPLFAGSGGYSAYLPDAAGRPVLVRAPDGVHLTAAGGDRLTAAVLKAVSRRWPLPE